MITTVQIWSMSAHKSTLTHIIFKLSLVTNVPTEKSDRQKVMIIPCCLYHANQLIAIADTILIVQL